MATVKHTITQADGWVEIAADGTDYLLENHCPNALKLTQQDAAPAEDAPYHTLPAWQGMIRVGTGAAYIRTSGDEDVVAVVTT